MIQRTLAWPLRKEVRKSTTNNHNSSNFSSVQFSRSVVSDSATPWIAACQASLSITNSRSSLRLTSIESVMPSSHVTTFYAHTHTQVTFFRIFFLIWNICIYSFSNKFFQLVHLYISEPQHFSIKMSIR